MDYTITPYGISGRMSNGTYQEFANVDEYLEAIYEKSEDGSKLSDDD